MVEHDSNDGSNEELSSLHADAVEAGLFVPVSASNSPPSGYFFGTSLVRLTV